MSQENVRVKNPVVRRLFWAFENDTAAFRDTLHPEIEWFPIDENRGRLYGIEAAVRNRNEWLDTWDEHRFELDEVFAEGDSVVVSVRITARGTMSGPWWTFASTPTSSCETTWSSTSTTTPIVPLPSKPQAGRSRHVAGARGTGGARSRSHRTRPTPTKDIEPWKRASSKTWSIPSFCSIGAVTSSRKEIGVARTEPLRSSPIRWKCSRRCGCASTSSSTSTRTRSSWGSHSGGRRAAYRRSPSELTSVPCLHPA